MTIYLITCALVAIALPWIAPDMLGLRQIAEQRAQPRPANPFGFDD